MSKDIQNIKNETTLVQNVSKMDLFDLDKMTDFFYDKILSLPPDLQANFIHEFEVQERSIEFDGIIKKFKTHPAVINLRVTPKA